MRGSARWVSKGYVFHGNKKTKTKSINFYLWISFVWDDLSTPPKFPRDGGLGTKIIYIHI
jgi:hypothetical protein